MEEILAGLDLKLKSKTAVSCPFFYQNIQDGVRSFMGTGPAAAALNLHDKPIIETVINNALQAYRLTEDMYQLQNSFLLFMVEK
jgi:hypothetical protein